MENNLKQFREMLDNNEAVDEIEIKYKLRRRKEKTSDDDPEPKGDDDPEPKGDDDPEPKGDDTDIGGDKMSDEKYTPNEFAEAAEKFWPDKNTRPSRYVIIAAFNMAGKTEATPEEGIELINNFMYEKVK